MACDFHKGVLMCILMEEDELIKRSDPVVRVTTRISLELSPLNTEVIRGR